MLDIKFLRENPGALQGMLDKRGNANPWKGETSGLTVESFFALDQELRGVIQETEKLRSRRNQISEEFPKLKKKGEDTSALSAEMDTLKKSLQELEVRCAETEQKMTDALLRIPNFPHESVHLGKSAEQNLQVRAHGTPAEPAFPPRQHWEIGEALGILDFAAASKLSGQRFSVLKGQGAALERALISFMLDLHTSESGYTEIFAPYLVTEKTMQGTGQLPKFEKDMFRITPIAESVNFMGPINYLYLIPTAEVSVTNLHRDDLLDEKKLPLKYACYSACFRREAGSYGKDTKGLIRNHQFNKVELVWFTTPERSFADLEKLTNDAEEVLKRLNIPYRVMQLCSGDLGFASAKTYDLEVWMPGEKGWREISSCSCFTDFQTRRMNIKHKNAAGKKELVHTLNGSGVAVGRLFAAILENYQQADGSVTIPEALRPYLKTDRLKA